MNISRTKKDRKPGFALLLPIALFAISATGCANVPPWDRGVLADYIMRADRDLLGDACHEHMWFSREAASGGRGIGGGGCGCN